MFWFVIEAGLEPSRGEVCVVLSSCGTRAATAGCYILAKAKIRAVSAVCLLMSFLPRTISIIAGFSGAAMIPTFQSGAEPPLALNLAVQMKPAPFTVVVTPVAIAWQGEQAAPDHGIYTALPYSLLVGVPPAVDPKLVISSLATPARMKSIEPPMRLIPWQR